MFFHIVSDVEADDAYYIQSFILVESTFELPKPYL